MSCFCAVTKEGKPAGCSCLSVVEGDGGPKFRETPISSDAADGTGRTLDAIIARRDRETERLSKAGPPPGAMVRR